jgi:Protein of unknown function (DUF3016)
MADLRHLKVLVHVLAHVLALTCAASLAHAAGVVEVKFVDPDKYSDVGRSSVDRERALAVFNQQLQALGKGLPDGQSLALSVTDIDLAGELRPTRHGSEIRVLRGRADWPRVTLSYELRDGARTLKSGDAKLADMAYLQQPLTLHKDDAYAYEMRMLKRWFDETIVAGKTTRP